MRVVAYLQPRRGGGVARHAQQMICGLAGASDVRLRVMASAPALHQAGYPAWLQGLDCTTHPFPETQLERCWKLTGLPPAGLFIRHADWVYSPAELRIPRCSARTAITVHDVQAFETDLPWSDTSEHHHFRKKWAYWLPKMIAETTRVLTVSEFTRQRLVELLHAPAEKIVVIGNGVENQFFAAGNAGLACDLQNPRVIIIGGLRTKKGAAATLAVAGELEQLGSPIQIDVIGQHDPEWVARSSAQPNMRLCSPLPDADIAARLAKSVALLFLSPYEGFGLPALAGHGGGHAGGGCQPRRVDRSRWRSRHSS